MASPCTFCCTGRTIRIYVQRDGCVSAGTFGQFNSVNARLEDKHQVKTHLFGFDHHQLKQVKSSTRFVIWSDARAPDHEAHPRHVEIIQQQLDLNNAKTITRPGTREEGRIASDQETPLDENHAATYRCFVARCNYSSPGRPDIAFSVKGLARHMAKPTRGDWARLTFFGRYLVGRPRLQQRFGWQPSRHFVSTYSDADWVGCRDARGSTTGGAITMGTHTLKG